MFRVQPRELQPRGTASLLQVVAVGIAVAAGGRREGKRPVVQHGRRPRGRGLRWRRRHRVVGAAVPGAANGGPQAGPKMRRHARIGLRPRRSAHLVHLARHPNRQHEREGLVPPPLQGGDLPRGQDGRARRPALPPAPSSLATAAVIGRCRSLAARARRTIVVSIDIFLPPPPRLDVAMIGLVFRRNGGRARGPPLAAAEAATADQTAAAALRGRRRDGCGSVRRGRRRRGHGGRGGVQVLHDALVDAVQGAVVLHSCGGLSGYDLGLRERR